MPRKIAAGNWKMNGDAAALAQIEAMADALPAAPPEVVICPPAPFLMQAAQMVPDIAIGAQDCHAETSGAHTGDLSAGMIAGTGARFVIIGHSERRAAYGESDADVRAKAEAAWAAGLTAIICIGESGADRDAGRTLAVITEQLDGSLPDAATAGNTVIAYEPIWAIGTGQVPDLPQINEVHDLLRDRLIARLGQDEGAEISLLYGGSVKADNAATIFGAANVNGALVGGASLKAADFNPIVSALAAS